MGYEFRGFFTNGGDEILAAAQRRWPDGKARTFRFFLKRIGGFRQAPPEGDVPDDEAEAELWHGRLYVVEKGLAEFSREFPGNLFVYLHVDCFGGTCANEGFVIRNGEKVESARGFTREGRVVEGQDALPILLKHLGLRLPRGGDFRPLGRGAFG